MGTPSPKHTAEFKQKAVELYRKSGTTYAEVARGLGCDPGSLSDWVKKADAPRGGNPFQAAEENRTEVQTHGEIGARFLRNHPEVAATAAVHKTSKREHLDAAVRVAILRTLMTPSVL